MGPLIALWFKRSFNKPMREEMASRGFYRADLKIVNSGSNVDTWHRNSMSGMTDSQLSRLGLIHVIWNGVERQMIACIWRLADWPQDVGEIVTAEMGNEARPTLLVNLSRQKVFDDLLRDQIDAAAEAFRATRDIRNDLAHGVYAWGFRSQQKPGTLLKFNSRQPTADGMVKITEVIASTERLDGFISDLKLLADLLPDLERNIREHQKAIDDGIPSRSTLLKSRVHGWRAPQADFLPLRKMATRLHRLRTSKAQIKYHQK